MRKVKSATNAETTAYCCLCSEVIQSQFNFLNSSPEFTSVKQSESVQEIQHSLLSCLSRYLKIDLRGELRSLLKVGLCKECGFINSKISELYRQLEKTEMELRYNLQKIHDKMGKTRKVTSKSLPVTQLTDLRSQLEKVVFKKCTQKLLNPLPFIQLQNLTTEKINEAKLNLAKDSAKDVSQSEDSNEAVANRLIDMKTETLPSSPPTYEESQLTDDFDDVPSIPQDMNDMDADSETAIDLKTNEQNETETKPALEISRPQFVYATKLREKCRVNIDTGKFACLECLKEFAKFPAFGVHYRGEHGKVRHTCQTCGRQFKQSGHRNAHQIRCPNMDKSTTPSSTTAPGDPQMSKRKAQRIILEARRSVNPDTGMRKCTSCQSEFPTEKSLQYHFKTVHLRKRCRHCGLEFNNREELQLHYKKDHFTCKLCGKEYLRIESLQRHMNAAHLKVLARVCDQCGKGFASSGELRRHMKTVHLKIRKHVCETCGKQFGLSSELKNHVEGVHLRLRDQVCDLCGRKFHRKTTITRHRRAVHPGAE